jgi:hypothetical protein
MPQNARDGWDLIAAPWHLDEHITDSPVPAGTVATIAPPLHGGTVPSRVAVLERAVADAVAGRSGRWCCPATAPSASPWLPGSSGGTATSPSYGWTRTATSTPRPSPQLAGRFAACGRCWVRTDAEPTL